MISVTNRTEAAQAIGEYASYLLQHECGLPLDAKLQEAAARLSAEVSGIVEREELSAEELRFFIANSIDIMPCADIGAAAMAAGFSIEARDRIVEVQSRLRRGVQGLP